MDRPTMSANLMTSKVNAKGFTLKEPTCKQSSMSDDNQEGCSLIEHALTMSELYRRTP